MGTDSVWVSIWAAVLSIGFGSFFLLVLVVMPFGARDIRRLFAKLDETGKREEQD